MPQSQMNVRIDDALKRQGDAIFARNGFSPSSAVRSLYIEAVRTNDVPRFMKSSNEAKDENLISEITSGAGMVWKKLGKSVPSDIDVDIASAKAEHATRTVERYGF